MKLGEIVNVYNVLGEATMKSAEVEEVLKVIEAREVMRPHVESWNAFFKDLQEKAQAWESMNEEQRAELDKAANLKLSKEIEIEFEKLSKKTIAVMIQENGFKVREIDLLGLVRE